MNKHEKYPRGVPSPVVIIAEGLTFDKAMEMEGAFISALGTKQSGGLLVNKAGYINTGWKHTDESRARIKQSNLGQKRTEETRKKVSQSRIGMKLSDSHKKAISAGLVGRMKGVKLSEAHKEKLRQAALLRKTYIRTEESRQQSKESALRRWAKKKARDKE